MYWICINCEFSDTFTGVFKTKIWFERLCPKCGSKNIWGCKDALQLRKLTIAGKCEKCDRRFNCWTNN